MFTSVLRPFPPSMKIQIAVCVARPTGFTKNFNCSMDAACF